MTNSIRESTSVRLIAVLVFFAGLINAVKGDPLNLEDLHPYATMEAVDELSQRLNGRSRDTALIQNRDMKIPNIFDGIGILALKKGDPKNRLACEAFFSKLVVLTPAEMVTSKYVVYRPTLWLDQRRAVELGDNNVRSTFTAKSCDRLLVSYDYARALPYLKHWKTDGPLLYANRPKSNSQSGIAFDLSGYSTPSDFLGAMKIWQREIATDPLLWNYRNSMSAPWYIAIRDSLRGAATVVDAIKFGRK